MICCSEKDIYGVVNFPLPFYLETIVARASSAAALPKAQHEPHAPWSRTGPTAPRARQSSAAGKRVRTEVVALVYV